MKNCECCGNKVEIVFPSTKFCNNCSLYIFNLKVENHSLKYQLKRRDKIIKRLKNDICRK